MSDFLRELSERTGYAENVIRRYLPEEEGFVSELAAAMNYSVNAGGKRLRPVFMDSVYRLCGGTGKVCEPFMAAMEYLHTYSLVHDDMPAIDNDAMRRGKPTTHKMYGEACALLAGDGLLHWSTQTTLKAFDMCGNGNDDVNADGAKKGNGNDNASNNLNGGGKDNIIRAFKIFAEKSGPYGMLGGQSADVLYTGKSPDKELLDYIYRLKTCALIEASMMIGAALAGADNKTVSDFEDIGRCVGMAFQIRDDILDCTGSTDIIGKPSGSDDKNGKTTYVTLFGLEQAKAEVMRLSGQAACVLSGIKTCNAAEKQFLLELIRSLTDRDK